MLCWSSFCVGVCTPTILSQFGYAQLQIKDIDINADNLEIARTFLSQNCFNNIAIFNASLAIAIFLSSVVVDKFCGKLST